MLDSHPEPAKEVPFRGSIIIYTGETIEEIRGLIKEDVYTKSGVWDVDNAQIIPVRLILYIYSASPISRVSNLSTCSMFRRCASHW